MRDLFLTCNQLTKCEERERVALIYNNHMDILKLKAIINSGNECGKN